MVAQNPKSALKLDPATDDSVAAALKDIKMAIQSTRMIQQQQQTSSSIGTRDELNAVAVKWVGVYSSRQYHVTRLSLTDVNH